MRACDASSVRPPCVTVLTGAPVRRVTEETVNAVPDMPPCGARGGECEALWRSLYLFDGRRMWWTVARSVGAFATARSLRIRHEVRDWTKSAVIDNPLWVGVCAFRNEHVENKLEHVEIGVIVVVVVAMWAVGEHDNTEKAVDVIVVVSTWASVGAMDDEDVVAVRLYCIRQ